MRFPRSHAAILTGLMMAADADGDERLAAAVQPVLALSEAEMLALIPERAGVRFVGCPNCDGGTQENQLGWTIVKSDCKKRARVNCMRHFLAALPYTNKDDGVVGRPDPLIVASADLSGASEALPGS